MLIGGMTAFGQAMVNTGTDRFFGNLILGAAGSLGVHGILAAFFVLTVLPIALATAPGLGANPELSRLW